MINRTAYYHHNDTGEYGLLIIWVEDASGNPVDGAKVSIASWGPFGGEVGESWNYTDVNGRCVLQIGKAGSTYNEGVEVHVSSKYGGGTMNDGYGARYIILGGETEEHTYILPGTLPRPEPSATEVSPPATGRNYRMEASYEVLYGAQYPPQAVSNDDDMRNYHIHKKYSDHHIDSFVCREPDFLNFLKGYSFDCHNLSKNSSLDNIVFDIPTTGNWYYVLSNQDTVETTKVVNLTVDVYPISPPTVDLITPDPIITDQIISGSSYEITWNATDADDPDPTLDVTVEYSPDGGTSWIILESGNNNDGTYTWDTTTVPDGVNYLVRVNATDSDMHTTTAANVLPFSIDNIPITPQVIPGSEWYFQVQASGLYKDLDMKPMETTVNTANTLDLTAPGQYMIDSWQSTETFTGANINGDWTFNIYGYADYPGTLDGYLYAIVKDGTGATLDTTVDDNENIGAFTSSHMFNWTDTLSGTITDGQPVRVEIWVNVITGSGGPSTHAYNYVGVTQAGGPHDAYFYDCNAMFSTGPDMSSGPPANEIYELTDTEYGNVSTSDDDWAISVDPGTFDEIFTWCDVQIAEDPATMTQIDMTFEGQAAAATDFQVWAFNQVTATWGQIGTAISAPADTDVTITRSITANCTDYISGTGLLMWGCYQTDASDLIRVDYLETTISYIAPDAV
ncbi:MAG: hypothetical protein KAX31_03400, partial [Thermoplasmata archaeon]|nr:hypothetical protein [Thermoplasmata archaeon]